MVWNRYRSYLETPPETVLEWSDAETDARGWLVLNSRRGGAAGGGTRMRPGLDREEVVYLAKTMELKFAFSGPPIGGAKSGIAFDPADPRRGAVLERWFGAILPFLSTCYGTGGDVNVDEQRDVVPACARLGLRHPQEGVARGHFDADGTRLEAILSEVDRGLRAPVSCADLGLPGVELAVADLITGYGVARGAERLYRHRGESLEGKRVIVEGFGNVGGAAALYLARAGARIVALVDADAALVRPDGLDAAAVEALLSCRTDRSIPESPGKVVGPDRERAYRTSADLFVPAAVSGSVDADRLADLEEAGVEVVVCGANQPFREVRLGDTAVQRRADRSFTVLADAVGGLGTARAFHHLMSTVPDRKSAELDPRDVFDAVKVRMERAVDAVVDRCGRAGPGLLGAALAEGLDRTGFP